MKKFWLVIFIGAVSAGLSYRAFYYQGLENYFLPGLIFGLAAIICLNIFGLIAREKLWKKIIFVFVSWGAYYAAEYTAISLYDCHIPDGNCNAHSSYLAFFVAGFVGALILSLGAKFLLKVITLKEVVLLALLGGVLGLSYSLNEDWGLLILYFVWQIGMLYAIVFFSGRLDPNKIN